MDKSNFQPNHVCWDDDFSRAPSYRRTDHLGERLQNREEHHNSRPNGSFFFDLKNGIRVRSDKCSSFSLHKVSLTSAKNLFDNRNVVTFDNWNKNIIFGRTTGSKSLYTNRSPNSSSSCLSFNCYSHSVFVTDLGPS